MKNFIKFCRRLSSRAPGRGKVIDKIAGVSAIAAFGLVSMPAAATPMRTSGQRLLDSCGNPFVVRGVEQGLGEQLPPGNDWLGLIEEISATGANAVRILPGLRTLTVADIDEVLTFMGSQHMVAYLAPLGDDGTWFGRADVRSMLAKHESYIIIDAYGEPQYDDRARFRREAVQAIAQVRDWGYRVPLTVTGNQFGRDLPSVLQYGAEIIAADPLANTIMGWQAYWGSGGYYQSHYGMTLTQAMQAIASSPFPIQIGLDFVTDPPSETMDFGLMMTAAETHGIGWLWWDWYNPYGTDNNLSRSGNANDLTPTGQTVINAHRASIANTSEFACSLSSSALPPGPLSTPAAPGARPTLAINAGGGAVGRFVADDPFSGANVSGGSFAPRSTASIDRSLIVAPAPPESVYQTERWGVMTYRVTGFSPQNEQVVQLHFAETFFNRVGARKFNVSINDERVLTEYDIIARAGAPNRAIQENIMAKANTAGEILIRFDAGSADAPNVSAIVVSEWPASAWQAP